MNIYNLLAFSLFDYNYCVSIKEGLVGRRSEGVIIETPTLGSSQTWYLKEQARGQAACARIPLLQPSGCGTGLHFTR